MTQHCDKLWRKRIIGVGDVRVRLPVGAEVIEHVYLHV